MSKSDNPVAVITGAASGIGRATALAYLAAGVNVLAVDVDDRGLNVLAKAVNQDNYNSGAVNPGLLEILASDIKDPVTARRTAALAKRAFGRIDYLFNNAGCELVAPLMETTPEQYDQANSSNCRACRMMSLPNRRIQS